MLLNHFSLVAAWLISMSNHFMSYPSQVSTTILEVDVSRCHKEGLQTNLTNKQICYVHFLILHDSLLFCFLSEYMIFVYRCLIFVSSSFPVWVLQVNPRSSNTS
ncbi:hypothetical protein Cni_G03829 [Canna indica]|uniref:Secreted protein n=1 Tax=Canna indica TaxID=4628 RepID=A0AAQ3Q3X4_9LILI|nr:hypothetical protein Cni_G03829 [Canna indica]